MIQQFAICTDFMTPQSRIANPQRYACSTRLMRAALHFSDAMLGWMT